MTVLVLGATGATGSLLVAELLQRGHTVRAIVRSLGKLEAHENLRMIQASVLDLSQDELAEQVSGCDAVASCLGHNLTFKGLYGQPRRLVTEAVRRVSEVVASTNSAVPVKFVLMNSSGVGNRDLAEPISAAQQGVIALLRFLVPPHADNEAAADYLRAKGQTERLEWAVVRPDNLTNEANLSDYEVYASPTRSAIFDAGKTSRVNVAHFMAELISNEATWQKWRGQMPVIYNAA